MGKGPAILRNVRLQKERPLPVIQGNRGATALVGMPGFVVGAQQLVDGELWLLVETTADFVGCRGCGTGAWGHGRSRTLVRDLPVAGRPTVLAWWKRRWRCDESNCEVETWSETTPQIASRAVLTERARRRLADMVNIDGSSIASAAAAFGVGWHTANQATADYTDPHVDDPERLEGVEAIGVDEKRFLNATPTHRTVFTTQVVDLDRHRVQASAWPPWTPPPAITAPSASVSPTPSWSWITSTPSGWRIRPSTTSVAASRTRRTGIGAAAQIRCIGSGGSC